MPITLITEEKQFEVVVDGATFYVTPMSNSAMTRLRKKHTKTVRGVETVDVDALYYERVDMTIKGWKEGDLLDANGKPLPCTSETKRILADRNARIAIEVLRLTDELDGEAKEAAEKNS